MIIRNDSLPEIVLTLPALRALRKRYPDAWMTLLVHRDRAAFARTLEDPDDVVVDPGSGAALADRLRSLRPDLVVCAGRDSRAPWAAWKAGARHRVGAGFHLYAPVLTLRVDEPRRPQERHEVEHALAFAHRAGADTSEAAFPIRLPRHERESAAHWLDLKRIDGPFVVLHPGSAGERASWPAAHFFQLATLLEAEGTRVVFYLGPDDGHVAEALGHEHPTIRRLPRFTGNAVSLGCLIERSAAVVGSGTGAVHLAAALSTPTLSLHPPWPSCGPERWGPYSSTGWSVVADLPEAMRWSSRKRRREGDALLAGVDPSTVFRAVRDLLEGRAPAQV